jgi:hypothetical protein
MKTYLETQEWINYSIPRGAIKRFRKHLNSENAICGTVWNNGPKRGQRTRPYGDYLYSQDRDKFMVDLRTYWLRFETILALPSVLWIDSSQTDFQFSEHGGISLSCLNASLDTLMPSLDKYLALTAQSEPEGEAGVVTLRGLFRAP